MDKSEILEIIKLLSALESWSFSTGSRLPDYLCENITNTMAVLTKELLK